MKFDRGTSYLSLSMFATTTGTLPLVRLKAMCGPGDEGEPVVSVMLPAED
jgi:hypothetical protein